MENVVVHIISHSHWDREWYLPFESHRMQLVELFDNLFDLFENDPEFKSFHLDGQTIVLDDYLEIRPENRDKVQRYIDEGKLKIGPFYILQDDYLISSEANAVCAFDEFFSEGFFFHKLAPFLKIFLPKETVEVSLEAAGEIETKFQGWVVLVVFNHIDGLSRDTDILG